MTETNCRFAQMQAPEGTIPPTTKIRHLRYERTVFHGTTVPLALLSGLMADPVTSRANVRLLGVKRTRRRCDTKSGGIEISWLT
jgi:hypothetical protein